MLTHGDTPNEQAGGSPGIHSAKTNANIFDRPLLLSRLEGDAELADEVVQIFIDECPGMVNRLRQAVASADAGQIQFAAHALKGAAANIAAEKVRAAALQLEIMGREGNLAGLAERLATLETEIAQLRNVLAPAERG